MGNVAKPRLCPGCGLKRRRGLCAACRAAQGELAEDKTDGRHSQHRCREIATSAPAISRLWRDYCAAIYGDAPPPYDVEWWFYCGATCLLDALGALSAATPFPGNPETDQAASENLHRLINEIRSDFRRIQMRSPRAEPRRDLGPN